MVFDVWSRVCLFCFLSVCRSAGVLLGDFDGPEASVLLYTLWPGKALQAPDGGFR